MSTPTRVPAPSEATSPAEPDPTIAAAIQAITESTQQLIRDEIELAKAEVTVKVQALLKGVVIGVAAGVFLLVAALMGLHGLAWLAFYILPVNSSAVFWGFFLVAGVFILLAVVAGLLAKKFVTKGTPPQPQMAIDEAKAIQATVKEARAAEVKR